MSSQIDFYTGIHKGQRDYLSKFSKQAGILNINDQEALTKLSTDYEELIEHFKVHAALEEQHIHPLLYDRIPEGAKDLEQDHKRQEQILEDLSKHLSNLLRSLWTLKSAARSPLSFTGASTDSSASTSSTSTSARAFSR
jgi:iron-sulfur cluster repair protein YtfE (RIC family)